MMKTRGWIVICNGYNFVRNFYTGECVVGGVFADGDAARRYAKEQKALRPDTKDTAYHVFAQEVR